MPTGGSWYAYLVIRRNGNDAYRPKIFVGSDGSVRVHSGVVTDNIESSLGAAVVVPGLTFQPGAWIWLRTQVSGSDPTTIKVKAWAAGQPEPSGWQFTATDSASTLQSPGAVGMRAYLGSQVTNAPIVVKVDDLEVDALP